MRLWVEMLRPSPRRSAVQYAFDPMTADCIDGDLAVPASSRRRWTAARAPSLNRRSDTSASKSMTPSRFPSRPRS